MSSLSSNIVHQYFKKIQPGAKILLKVDPIRLRGVELTIPDEGEASAREMDLDPGVFEKLATSGFIAAGPLEFHLYDAGLVGPGEQ